jgi:hypothetical protein
MTNNSPSLKKPIRKIPAHLMRAIPERPEPNVIGLENDLLLTLVLAAIVVFLLGGMLIVVLTPGKFLIN